MYINISVKWDSLKDIVLVTGQGLHSTTGEASMVRQSNVCTAVQWCIALNMLGPQNHATFLTWEGSGRVTPHVFVWMTPLLLLLASDVDGLHK